MKLFDKRLFLVLLVFQLNLVDAEKFSYGDFNIDQPLQVQANSEIRLKCGIRAKDVDLMENSEVLWFFKSCGEGYYNRTSCKNIKFPAKEWMKIVCGNGQTCKPTLVIQNVTTKDSGLYLCKIYPYKTVKGTFQIQLVKTYEVDVINFNDFIEIDLPDSNVTVYEKSQNPIVLNCRVSSKNRPVIKWFKRKLKSSKPLEEFKNSSVKNGNFYHVNMHISDYYQYFESNYELISSAGELEISDDTFLSKVIINNVSKSNAGLYVCVGINYGGFKTKEATVNVISPLENPNLEQELAIHSKHFNELLFLLIIPIILVIGPILYYTCYLLICRKISKNNLRKNDVNSFNLSPYYQIRFQHDNDFRWSPTNV